MNSVVAALVALAGMGLSVQVAMNARLRETVQSPVLSALISFMVGGFMLALLALSGVFGRGRLTQLGALPGWAWCGGLMGAFYVTIALVSLPRIGSAAVVACTVGGQLAAALVLDYFGWLGVPRAPLNISRVLGALLLFVGVLLLQRK